MSIDAVIERVIPRDGRLRLRLAPRVDREGRDTIPGRIALTILGERHFEPQVGMEIWGGADVVEIVKGPSYDRKGSFLRERRNCPRCFAPMHWAEIYDEATGQRRECLRCDPCGAELAVR